MSSNTFNAIDFLYYNPELQAYSNISTIESASNFYYTDPNGTQLMYDTSIVSSNLNAFVFLSTNKDILPISSLNKVIYDAMRTQNLTDVEIIKTSDYVTSIYQDVSYTSNNTFTLVDGSYTFTSSNIRIGDAIRIYDNIKQEYHFTVSNVSSSSILIHTHKYVLNSNVDYFLDGIRVYDPLRVAKIFLVRQGTNTLNNTSNVLPESGVFNPTLYKVLYPNAARLTDQDAYIDYVSKRKNNVLRVNNADEILANYIATSNVQITGVNNSINRTLPAGESNRLVTEYAVRSFTETLFGEVANNANFSQVFVTSNFTASGPADFTDDVDIKSNLKVRNSSILVGRTTLCNTLRVMQPSTFNSNVTIDKNALIYGSLSVNGNMYNPRIGIGYFMNSNNPTTTSAGQITASYDSNWISGGIRFRSFNGSNDAGIAQGSNGFLRFLSPSNDGAGGFQWLNASRNIIMQLNQSGNLNVFGNVISPDINLSDKRYKENIETFTDYEKYISRLNPVSFKWGSNIFKKEKIGHSDIGLIAQEVAEIYPQAHSETEYMNETIHIIKYEKFVPLLISACKDLHERVQQLEYKLSNYNV